MYDIRFADTIEFYLQDEFFQFSSPCWLIPQFTPGWEDWNFRNNLYYQEGMRTK